MTTVKLSYSILDAWAHGRWEQAVGNYLGQPLPATPELELGKLKHQIWERDIRKAGRIPEELGGGELKAPKIEQKYQKLIPLSDDIQILLRGVPDLTDDTTIYEWKCGRTPAAAYVESMQLDYYKLLLPKLKVGIYRCFNPYDKTYGVGVKYLNQSNAESALEHVITFGGEMIDYLRMERKLKNFSMEAV